MMGQLRLKVNLMMSPCQQARILLCIGEKLVTYSDGHLEWGLDQFVLLV